MTLYYYEEKSVGEIAAFMECSEGTVKSRLHYARKKIREEIEIIEKRDNINLHSAAIIPLLGSILSKDLPHTAGTAHPSFESLQNRISETATGNAVSNADEAAGSHGSHGSHGGNDFPAKKLSPIGKLFGKTATKVVAGVLSAALVFTGGVVVANKTRDAKEAKETVDNTDASAGDTHGNNKNPSGNGAENIPGNGMSDSSENASEDVAGNAVNVMGNTPGNLNNGGLAAMQGEQIYYYCGKHIHSVNTNGNNEKILVDSDVSSKPHLNVVGDWVYYIANDGVRAVKTDGSANHMVIDAVTNNFIVVEDWIYYNDHVTLYRIKTDGSDKQKLNDRGSWFTITDDWIYFERSFYDDTMYGDQLSLGESKLYRMKTDGSDEQMLIDENVTSMIGTINVVDGWVYYCDLNNHRCLTRQKIDGSDKQKLIDDSQVYFNVTGDRIYYSGFGIYAIKTDGTNPQKIHSEHAMNINVVGDWIYCVLLTGESDQVYYRMMIDGSDGEELKDIINNSSEIASNSTMENLSESVFGNTAGNINNMGYAAIQGDWIYFSWGGIYAMKTDGSDLKKLIDVDRVRYLNVVGDWIYYSNGTDDQKIYAVKTDGSDNHALNDVSSSDITVVGNQIYYYTSGSLYTMKTDGSNNHELIHDAGPFNIVGERIYYFGSDGLYTIKTDGSVNYKLADIRGNFINVVGDWIYYSKGGGIYAVRTDGSVNKKLVDNALFFNIAGDLIYYIGDGLSVMKTDGTDNQKIEGHLEGITGLPLRGKFINIVGDWITNGDIIVKTDGSEATWLADLTKNMN